MALIAAGPAARSVAQNDLPASVARAPIIQPFVQGGSTGSRTTSEPLCQNMSKMKCVSIRPCAFRPPCKDRVPASSSSSSPSLVSTGHIFWLTVWQTGTRAGWHWQAGRARPSPRRPSRARSFGCSQSVTGRSKVLRKTTPYASPHSLRRSDGRFNQPQISRVPFASFAHPDPATAGRAQTAAR